MAKGEEGRARRRPTPPEGSVGASFLFLPFVSTVLKDLGIYLMYSLVAAGPRGSGESPSPRGRVEVPSQWVGWNSQTRGSGESSILSSEHGFLYYYELPKQEGGRVELPNQPGFDSIP